MSAQMMTGITRRALAAACLIALAIAPTVLAGCVVQAPSAATPSGRIFDRLALTPETTSGSNAVAQLALAQERSCARMVNGTVKCWGLLHDDRVQLSPSVIGNVDDVVDLAVGYDHSCVLEKSGAVRCWGSNDHGQLGDGTHNDALFPTGNPGLFGVTQVAVGDHFTCARHESSAVSCWGKNSLGELADGTVVDRSSPVLAPSLTGVLELALSRERGVAIDRDGRILFWGGNSVLSYAFASEPLSLSTSSSLDDAPRVIDVETSVTHSCALLSDGTVRCWGSNQDGELGDGANLADAIDDDRATPAPVIGLTHVVQIAVGRGTSCARLVDGTARCWGLDNYDQLGDGDDQTMSRSLAVPVAKLEHCKQIAIAYGHACALLDGGEVQCWGSNGSGELGDRTRRNRKVRGPVLW